MLGEEFCTQDPSVSRQLNNQLDMLCHSVYFQDRRRQRPRSVDHDGRRAAPKEEHDPSDCQPRGKKAHFSVDSHIYMIAAAQSFISGATSKTTNMPTTRRSRTASSAAFRRNRDQGQRAHRDGSNQLQPLAASLVEDDEEAAAEIPRKRLQTNEKAKVLAEKVIEKIIIREVVRPQRV
jgi:ribonucleoside-diphosphate reductase alpha chain